MHPAIFLIFMGYVVLTGIGFRLAGDRIKELIKARGYSGLYVVGPKVDGPSKIGLSDKIWTRISGIKTGYWEPLYVFRLFWVPGRQMAEGIEKELHEIFKGDRLQGEWFKLSASQAAYSVTQTSKRLFPSSWIKTHQQMISLLASELGDEE